MAEQEKKLGTKIEYLDPEGTELPVEMRGVLFMPGESVDLKDFIADEQQQQQFATKLAGNPYFKVEGGPDHKKTAELKAKQEEKRAQALEKIRGSRQGFIEPGTPMPPEGYEPPNGGGLETQAGQRAGGRPARRE